MGSDTRSRGSRGVVTRFASLLWHKGAVEVTVLLLAAAVASGVLLGAGVARASSSTSDGSVWVPRADTGTLVQMNPVTGQPMSEVNVGLTAGEKSLSQGNGVVVVHDPVTGKSVSLNVGNLLVTGTRTDRSAGLKQLYEDGNLYIADLQHGVIRAVNPVSLSDRGEAFSTSGALADVVVDKTGTVWALGADAKLTSLRWSDQAHRFVTVNTTAVGGATPTARLVPHDAGVTMFAPGSGAVVQIGTGDDVAAVVPGLTGDVVAAASSPRGLSAVSVPGSSTTVILSGGSVVATNVGTTGCAQPGAPAVFGDKVYVPCTDSGIVLVLGPDGRKAGPDVVTGAGTTPLLTVDDDALVVTDAAGTEAITVGRDGTQHDAGLADSGVSVVTASADVTAHPTPETTASSTPPTNPPSSTPPSTTPRTGGDHGHRSGQPGGRTATVTTPAIPTGTADITSPTGATRPTTPSSEASTTARTTGTATCVADCTPPIDVANVTASVTGSDSVVVSWKWTSTSPAADSYAVQSTDGGDLTTIAPGATRVTLTGLRTGVPLSFVVVATYGTRQVSSSASGDVVIGTATSSPADNSPTDGGVPSQPPTTPPSSAQPPTASVPMSAAPTTPPTTSTTVTTTPTTSQLPPVDQPPPAPPASSSTPPAPTSTSSEPASTESSTPSAPRTPINRCPPALRRASGALVQLPYCPGTCHYQGNREICIQEPAMEGSTTVDGGVWYGKTYQASPAANSPQPEVVRTGSGVRYAAAIGLLALAGLIRLGRRMGEAADRSDVETDRRTRRVVRRGHHR